MQLLETKSFMEILYEVTVKELFTIAIIMVNLALVRLYSNFFFENWVCPVTKQKNFQRDNT